MDVGVWKLSLPLDDGKYPSLGIEPPCRLAIYGDRRGGMMLELSIGPIYPDAEFLSGPHHPLLFSRFDACPRNPL